MNERPLSAQDEHGVYSVKTPWLDDGDVTLYHGDVLDVLRELPDESVDCVVTSPPYWGLRDYGTGEWDGGEQVWRRCPECGGEPKNTAWDCEDCNGDGGWYEDCDHLQNNRYSESTTLNAKVTDGASEAKRTPYRDKCGKCGATRVDQQMGLEPTPDLFVQNMVEVFREVRRVLAPHGTCWVNLGDSYNSPGANNNGRNSTGLNSNPAADTGVKDVRTQRVPTLKPKDLVGIPWRVAFALQQDGWYLRSDIIWSKPNPMPESVTDRPTKSHEYVFLLTKRPRYWFDAEAVRETAQDRPIPAPEDKTIRPYKGPRINNAYAPGPSGYGHHPNGRNVRSVWQIATQPYPEAHFATFPEELARRCIVAGCAARVCRVCGKPSERIVERTVTNKVVGGRGLNGDRHDGGVACNADREYSTLGWSDCGCLNEEDANRHAAVPGTGAASSSLKWRPGIVLDPFMGSGTVAKVARDHQRHAIGIDLNHTYLELAARRLQQLSLLT